MTTGYRGASGFQINRRGLLLGAAGLAGTAMIGLSPAFSSPKKGGVVRIGMAGAAASDSLDPAKYIDLHMFVASWSLRNNLTETAPNGDVIGELAESWEASPDLKRWVFTLREGIEFHNGKTLEAADVVASMNHHRGEDSTSPGKAILGNVAEITADGRNVIFTLNNGNADMAAILSDVRMPIMPVGPDGKVDTSGVGTGGYVLKEFEPGVRVVATRNANYWKEGRAHFDGVELLAINDVAARTSALQSGAIDIMHRVSTKTVALLGRVSDVEIVEVPSKTHFAAGMLVSADPFGDNDVRLALKYAVDRQALVNATLDGHGIVGNDHPIGPVYKYYSPDIPQREYDPEKAKFHLKKAGHSSLALEFKTSPAISDTAVDAAVQMQESARAAGVEIKITQEPADGYWGNVWGKVPFCAAYYSGRATAGQQLAHAYGPGAPANATGWTNERFVPLMNEASSTLDESKRQELFHEIQQLVHDDGANIVFQFSNLIDACKSNIGRDEQISGLFELDGARAVERWWFNS